MNDNAETPEEFYGLDPITKRPYDQSHEPKAADQEVGYAELGGTIYEEGELNAFQRTVLWYENLRPIKKDLIMLAIASIIFTIIMILINTLLP